MTKVTNAHAGLINVTNAHAGLINVAGVDIRPGATVAIPDDVFKKWSNGNAAKQWLKAGVVTTDSKVKVEDAPEGASEREQLEAKAKALGIEFSADTSDEDLTNAVVEASEQKADNDREALLKEARDLGLNPNANTGVEKLKKMIADKKAQ